jgi:hypothetical protein
VEAGEAAVTSAGGCDVKGDLSSSAQSIFFDIQWRNGLVVPFFSFFFNSSKALA